MVNKTIVAACFALFAFARFAGAEEVASPKSECIQLDSGIRLNYIEAGSGTPVIFIHGTLGDMYMWTSFVESFGKNYHAIAYSRRYNYPNCNSVPPKANHSTAIEAKDLADVHYEVEAAASACSWLFVWRLHRPSSCRRPPRNGPNSRTGGAAATPLACRYA